MTKFTYIGSGGKKPRTPVITNDNLFSKDKVEILLGVGEGPILGLEDGLKSFFAGDVPLNDKDGQPIIKDLVATPYQGNSTPQVINFALGGESASTSVGVNILQKSPVVRYTPENFRGKINKLDIRLNIAQLFREESNGDVLNNTAEFRIEYKTARGTDPWVVLDFTNATPNGPNPFPNLSGITFQVATHTDTKNKYQLIGKTGSGFVIDFRVTVAPITDDDYVIRVTKFNPDTDNSVNLKVACDIVFDSFQTIYQVSRSFTNTALMHVTGRANDQFSDIPDFYGIYKGLVTKVPSNRVENAVGDDCYEPDIWNGALTPAWHSNPAWVLYDLLDNPRYGMRRYAPTLNIYTQDFYEAGVYCDNGVSNYFGTGDEKRYTMNITLAENQNGWETLQNLAGAFDAVLYDDGEGNVRLKVDKWVEPRVLFTPETATVEGINYSFTDINTQYNSITVSFTNPERGWQETRLKVKNDTFIDLNGEIPLDFVAVGCTSESEALRRAHARLLTANHEKTIAAFTTTRLGLILDPLEIVYLADPLMGWGVSGRISHTSGNFIYLRDGLAHILVSTPADIYIQTTTGIYQGTVTVTQTNPAILLVTSAGFETLDLPELTQFCLGNFTTSSGSLIRGPKPFRITAIEPSKDYNTFQLTALEVYKDKYDVLGDDLNRTLLIDKDTSGVNLKKLFADKGNPLTRMYESVTFVIDGTLEQQAGSFLLIHGITVNDYALTVGDWTGLLPVGVKPKLVFKGAVKVMGRGGKGGDGGDLIPISPIYEGYYEYYYGRDLGRPDYSQVSIMGGHRGEDGGNAVFTDYPVDIELAAGANVELIGGYGGGYGSDAGAVLIQEQWLLETVQNVKNCVKRVQGSGGSGGWPFGQGGSAGGIAQNPVHAVPSGASGDKENAGGLQTANSPFMVVRPMQYSGGQGAIQHSLGSAGKPLSALGNPVPYLLFDFPPNTELLTYVGDRTMGSQGIGVVNHGNMTITTLGAGSVLTYNTISGYTTLTG